LDSTIIDAAAMELGKLSDLVRALCHLTYKEKGQGSTLPGSSAT